MKDTDIRDTSARKIRVFGDSILKGIQFNDTKGRYEVNDNLGYNTLMDGCEIENLSKFGCTVTKAYSFAPRIFSRSGCDYILMDFGGNDADFNWREISANPKGKHCPNTELYDFENTYCSLIDYVRSTGAKPVLMNLPPIDSRRYFDYFCNTLKISGSRVMSWLGDISIIGKTQEAYSRMVNQIAADMSVPLVDVRSRFLSSGQESSLLCTDGIHPNTAGQRIIHSCLEQTMALIA